MDFKSIESLIKTLSNSSVNYLEIEDSETKIKLSKLNIIKEDENSSKSHTNDVEVISGNGLNILDKLGRSMNLEEFSKETKGECEDNNYYYIKSPMVGTFYSSATENGEPYVKIGDEIVVGKELCIIEAMKLMNEIESEVAGTIVEVMINNGDIVEFGQPLFKVKL